MDGNTRHLRLAGRRGVIGNGGGRTHEGLASRAQGKADIGAVGVPTRVLVLEDDVLVISGDRSDTHHHRGYTRTALDTTRREPIAGRRDRPCGSSSRQQQAQNHEELR